MYLFVLQAQYEGEDGKDCQSVPRNVCRQEAVPNCRQIADEQCRQEQWITFEFGGHCDVWSLLFPAAPSSLSLVVAKEGPFFR